MGEEALKVHTSQEHRLLRGHVPDTTWKNLRKAMQKEFRQTRHRRWKCITQHVLQCIAAVYAFVGNRFLGRAVGGKWPSEFRPRIHMFIFSYPDCTILEKSQWEFHFLQGIPFQVVERDQEADVSRTHSRSCAEKASFTANVCRCCHILGKEEWRAGWSLLDDLSHIIITADGSVWLYVQLYFVTVYTDANKFTYTNINICKHTYMHTCALLAL